MANERCDFPGTGSPAGHHTNASSVVIDVMCWSDGAVAGIRLEPSVLFRSRPDRRKLSQLRRDDPRYVSGRRSGGGSEWRTRLSLCGWPGFSLPGERGKEGSMASRSRDPPSLCTNRGGRATHNDAPAHHQ